MSLNRVQLIGRAGATPEIKTLSSGSKVANFNLATSERWTDKDGQKQEKTEWHRLVIFGKLAEIVAKYVLQGDQVFCEGQLQTRSWEDQQGVKRYTTEVIVKKIEFFGSKQKTSDPEPEFGPNDEIPF